MALPTDPRKLYRFMRDELDKLFPQVGPMEFYAELFPAGSLERAGSTSDHQGRGITLQLLPGDGKTSRTVRRAYVFDGLAELPALMASDHTTVMAPMTYWGKARSLRNAHMMHAIAVDLDGPRLYEDTGFKFNFFAQVHNGIQIPPTFTVLSGHGLHLYYLLEEPWPMYPANQQAAQTLKRALTEHIWTSWNSTIEKPQIEGINQAFRLVGGVSKLGRDYPVTAWRSGAPVTLDQLTDIIRNKKARNAVTVMLQPRINWDEAAEQYPEWAKRVQERKHEQAERPRHGGTLTRAWPVNRGLYEWWLGHAAEASYGHRYFYLMTLAIYAAKCQVPKEEARAAALALLELLTQNGPPDHPMTKQDVDAAFRAYSDAYLTFPRKTVEELTAIPIPPNKRNHRKQPQHLKLARAARDIDDPEGTWRAKGGSATSKEDRVRAYLGTHPDATPTEVARAIGVSRPTVYKYMPARPSARERVESYAAAHPEAGPTQIARATGISRPTVSKYLRAACS